MIRNLYSVSALVAALLNAKVFESCNGIRGARP